MLHRLPFALCLIVGVVLLGRAGADEEQAISNSCVECHAAKQTGFNVVHEFAANSCVACHAGNAASLIEDVAHNGLIAFPGDLQREY